MFKLNKSKREDNIKFREWMLIHWNKAGGLITPVTAARILAKSKGRISQMIDEGKLKSYKYEPERLQFLSYAQVIEIALDDSQKTLHELIDEELEPIIKKIKGKVPDPLLQQLIKTSHDAIDYKEK